MEPILDTSYDSQSPTTRQKNSARSRGKAAKSPQKSKGFSGSDRAPGGTRPADWKPAGSEVGLSILQAGFDQALDEGLIAKLGELPRSEDGIFPKRILIEVWGATICPDPECRAWTTETICPACGSQIG
jgi:hypothetical protein